MAPRSASRARGRRDTVLQVSTPSLQKTVWARWQGCGPGPLDRISVPVESFGERTAGVVEARPTAASLHGGSVWRVSAIRQSGSGSLLVVGRGAASVPHDRVRSEAAPRPVPCTALHAAVRRRLSGLSRRGVSSPHALMYAGVPTSEFLVYPRRLLLAKYDPRLAAGPAFDHPGPQADRWVRLP